MFRNFRRGDRYRQTFHLVKILLFICFDSEWSVTDALTILQARRAISKQLQIKTNKVKILLFLCFDSERSATDAFTVLQARLRDFKTGNNQNK